MNALSDTNGRYRAVFVLALAYAIVWALYGMVSHSSQGITPDMGELLVWAREPALGYPKHPPFLSWMLMAWFSIFPSADWSYYLFAGLNLGAGLFAAFLLAGEWLQGPKQAVVPFLLAVIPFYNFLGLKFDQNSALIPLWALTIWAFVRSLGMRRAGYAALAGLLGALCLLSKYWSAFLLLGIGLAALCDRRRVAYFTSSAPYVSMFVGVAAMAPHIYWLFREHFPPFTWVATRRTSQSVLDALGSFTEYSAGTLGYAAVVIILVLLFIRPTWKGLRDGLFPRDNDRRTGAILFWAPMVIPVVVAFALRVNLLSLWNTPALNLLPVVMLASPLVSVTRDRVTWIALVSIATSVLALLVSPLVAFVILRVGVENYAAYTPQLAAVLEREWKRDTDRPLRLVAGPFPVVSGVAVYVPERPSTFADFSHYLSPWVDDKRIAEEGVGIICPQELTWCIAAMDALAAKQPASRKLDVELTARWLGFEGSTERFTVAIVPPSRE